MLTSPPTGLFGRTVCAMVTPFTADGRLDLDGARRLAGHLVGEGRCDGLVLNGTTGESPTTTDEEKTALVRAVADAVGDRARITAGVGSADTRGTVALARAAEAAGAHGVLVVTPYYSRPPQEDVAEHFRTVADAVGVPVMLYDIPGRTGTRIEPETMLRLAEHPRIAGVKDCAYDLLGSAKVIAATELAYYSGSEELNLPLRAVGAVGCVSTVANVAGPAIAAVLDAYDRGANAEAARLHGRTLPLVELMMSAGLPGTVTAKALLNALDLPAGPVRAPLRAASPERTGALLEAYERTLSSPSGGTSQR
ncbi:4-hydroxy-tetrahydrodipicolinate synthase [Streptomyces albireticuli]|uniref:4-hydroxy-tetrahydrodipicolinate synthase n=2 Tax=Streptomyces albireticuli TaxID=1940 RepID=A0A2A2D302_9ACTN|nr:4-hydroxy-tetrahydrodipicolinate synthase [Streptomyces albireticuli]PAU45837.1 4-hydroxy-tetrahydrodipicolinate synthase [Streptomyces albireticuli]